MSERKYWRFFSNKQCEELDHSINTTGRKKTAPCLSERGGGRGRGRGNEGGGRRDEKGVRVNVTMILTIRDQLRLALLLEICIILANGGVYIRSFGFVKGRNETASVRGKISLSFHADDLKDEPVGERRPGFVNFFLERERQMQGNLILIAERIRKRDSRDENQCKRDRRSSAGAISLAPGLSHPS